MNYELIGTLFVHLFRHVMFANGYGSSSAIKVTTSFEIRWRQLFIYYFVRS